MDKEKKCCCGKVRESYFRVVVRRVWWLLPSLIHCCRCAEGNWLFTKMSAIVGNGAVVDVAEGSGNECGNGKFVGCEVGLSHLLLWLYQKHHAPRLVRS